MSGTVFGRVRAGNRARGQGRRQDHSGTIFRRVGRAGGPAPGSAAMSPATTAGRQGRGALVLGRPGPIGGALVRALRRRGFRTTGIAGEGAPGGDWQMRDLPRLGVEDWRGLLDGVEVVVDATGPADLRRDPEGQAHAAMLARLARALGDSRARLIHLSRPGADEAAAGPLPRAAGRAEAALAEAPDLVILRPGLVLAPGGEGPAALLHGLAALPLLRVEPRSGATVQTLHVDDLSRAVCDAAEGRIPHGTRADLAEPRGRPVAAVIDALRGWQGLERPARRFAPGPGALRLLGAAGAGLARLGWRGALTPADLLLLEDGVAADPGAWRAAGGATPRPLEASLAAMPAGRPDRLAARCRLLLPLALAALALGWTLAGIGGLWRALPGGGWAAALLPLAQLALGLALPWRRLLRPAALGIVALSLAGSALATLGPVPALPQAGLTGAALALVVLGLAGRG